ncbi:hypothetical protein EST38_g11396 [Candolleomyces aberdarensis]|uniref:F-box domain-containing protein n=1 Tax=Candolleomyces aberdarensis TaxID=2316362 RepID=A0A4Q2D7A4_9AGAR|nr:hypothetical protein EST38_g11396 [Candolleomyces aberdarensis]
MLHTILCAPIRFITKNVIADAPATCPETSEIKELSRTIWTPFQGSMKHVPNEVWMEIVRSAALTNGISSANGAAVMAFGSVCSVWRSVTLTDRILWTSLNLDTIKSAWFQKLLHRSKNAPLSFISHKITKPDDAKALQVWTLVHLNFHRCSHLDVSVTIDPEDARDLGPLLLKPAPALKECSIRYMKTMDFLRARVIISKLSYAYDILPKLFADAAPSLHTLHLRDCHYLQHQNLFPNLLQFSSINSNKLLDDHTEFHRRRGAIHVFKSLTTCHQLKHLTLHHAIHDWKDGNFGAQLVKLGTVALPLLESLRFSGGIEDAQSLLEVTEIGPKCSMAFHLLFHQPCWNRAHPQKLVSAINQFLDRIPKSTSFGTLMLGDSNPYLHSSFEDVYFKAESQTGPFFELKIGNRGVHLNAQGLSTEERWSLHPRRLSTRGPSVSEADVIFSTILKRISSDSLLPHSNGTLELSLSGTFRVQQTFDIFSQMDGITHISFQRWDAICTPAFHRNPTRGVPFYFPNLTSLSFNHDALTTERTIHALVEYLSCRLALFGAMPQLVVLTHAAPLNEMKISLERRLEKAKEHFLSRTEERDLEGADISMCWKLI